jgi:hypothetical protein
VVLSLLLTSCGTDADGPDPFDPRGEQTGTSGGSARDTAILGSWRNVVVVQVPGDIQTWTTIWVFGSDGICRQTVESESLSEGLPRLTLRDCSFVASGDRIAITFVGGGTVEFDYFFAGFSPDRLVLDGFEYERLS